MKTIALDNIVWKEGEYFVAQCLNVEVSSFGETKEEALYNLNEALELYFEDIPTEKLTKIESPELVKSLLEYA
jgi:predicted RNase H-like HicB family nuclease